MLVCFTLTMPRNNSWNDRWSGEDQLYAKIIDVGRSQKTAEKYRKVLNDSPYYYDFGDGWRAQVSVSFPTPAEARSIRKRSVGFCGYDWMIDEIRFHGEIRPLATRVQQA